ncbi:hypothetical protein KPL47_02790 [Clostridium estertheticum]|uniref:hypothetical protein n=1 Tax=Clostridium estertheticum TaxID=238834 RepID=UPI001C0B59E7|nr:hypothetical protein [Clostridium estertheticum]MBU3175290.1 hypothetical protein [Clostridium estertheticum]
MFKKKQKSLIVFILFLSLLTSMVGFTKTYAATVGVNVTKTSVKYPMATLSIYIDNNRVKKILEYVSDAGTASGAIAGISAVIPKTALASPYIGAAAGAIAIEYLLLKYVTKSGTYAAKITFRIIYSGAVPITNIWISRQS